MARWAPPAKDAAMADIESLSADGAFTEALADARVRLAPPVVRERLWPALLAAAFFAVSALVFATAAILAPPAQLTPVVSVRGPV
jgi:hypothetical protein